MAIDQDKMNDLLGRFLNDFGGTLHSAMAVIGDKLGLYKAMAEALVRISATGGAQLRAIVRRICDRIVGQSVDATSRGRFRAAVG